MVVGICLTVLGIGKTKALLCFLPITTSLLPFIHGILCPSPVTCIDSWHAWRASCVSGAAADLLLGHCSADLPTGLSNFRCVQYLLLYQDMDQTRTLLNGWTITHQMRCNRFLLISSPHLIISHRCGTLRAF